MLTDGLTKSKEASKGGGSFMKRVTALIPVSRFAYMVVLVMAREETSPFLDIKAAAKTLD